MPNVRMVPSPAHRRRLLKGCGTYFLNVRPDLAALPIVPIKVPLYAPPPEREPEAKKD
jgi:hypothetical protein